MKLLLFTLVGSLMSYHTHAQLERGNFLVGGAVTFKNEKVSNANDKSRDVQLSVSPMAGLFIVNKLATGISFSYNRYRSLPLSPTLGYIKTYSFSYSPFLRYYILGAQLPYNILTQVSYSYTKFTEKFESGGKMSEGANGVTLSAGPVIFLSPELALEFVIGYRRAKRGFELGNERTILSSVALQVHLGKTKN